MRIAKKNVTADTNTNTNTNTNESKKYDACMTHIKAAIDALGPFAKDDIKACDALANLSVILFDLQ